MNAKQIRASVEAMLFAVADPVSADKLAQAAQLPQPTVEDRISFRVSARALFIVIAAGRVLYEFGREKVLDVFI